jgi:amino acid transporter
VAEDKLMPALLQKKNRHGAPVNALLLSCGVVAPLILLTINENISKQVFTIIDFSVQASLLIYIACALSLVKTLRTEGEKWWGYENLIAWVAIAFCVSMCASSDLTTFVISLGFVVSGVPLHYFWLRHHLHHTKSS